MKFRSLLLITSLAWLGATGIARAQFMVNPSLPIPEPLPATDVSDFGYTAHWEPLTGVQGYYVWTYVARTAEADDDIFYLFNSDFSYISSLGTPDNPDDNGTTDSGFVFGNFNQTPYKNWLIGNPVYADGVLGLNNAWYRQRVNAQMGSPLYDMSVGDGKVYVSMTVRGDQRAKSLSIVLFNADKQIYEQEVDSKTVPVTTEWTRQTIELSGGAKNCYLSIQGNDDGQGSALYYLFDDLSIYQKLHKGETSAYPCDYKDVMGAASSSQTMDLDPALIEGGLHYEYLLTSYNDGYVSNNSSLVRVTPETTGISSTTTDTTPTVRVDGLTLTIHPAATGACPVSVYDASGRVAYSSSATTQTLTYQLPAPGVYVVKTGLTTTKCVAR